MESSNFGPNPFA